MTDLVPLAPAEVAPWRSLECECPADQPEMTYKAGCPRCEGWSEWMAAQFRGMA